MVVSSSTAGIKKYPKIQKSINMKKFNINEYMYIQITEHGWKHLEKTVGNDYIKHCIENRKVEVENETWYRLQCHNVFDLFPINVSMRPFFNTNVMFDDEALT